MVLKTYIATLHGCKMGVLDPSKASKRDYYIF